MSERSERSKVTVRFAQWCTTTADAGHSHVVHQ